MSGTRLRWAAALGAVLACQGSALRSDAQDLRGPATLGRPIATRSPGVTLERPVPLTTVPPSPAPPFPGPPATALPPVTPAAYLEPGAIVRGQAPDGPYQSLYQPPAPPPPSGAAPVAPYGAPDSAYIPGAPYDQPLAKQHGFWDKCRNWFGGSNGNGFNCHSDGAFEGLITPVSNPFFFEDPRSVTELRPLFIGQTSPGRAPFFAGGSSFFYGVQGRLALNDRWSVVLNKLGFVTFNPKDPGLGVNKGTGFAEVNIGPKFTFLHNTATNTVAAVGVNLDLPFGSTRVMQDTGSLSIDPYFTIGQTFGSSQYGQFNFVGTVGYNFSVDNTRSEFFHSGLHLDYDIARAHKWYPLIELNWFHYTQAGKARNLNVEGIDLGNFGSTGVAGHDDLSLAAGFRYKFSEHIQTGLAVEFPLIRAQDIQDFRVTFDLIFRY